MYDLRVEDLQFPTDTAFVGVSNHISYVDAPLIVACSNVKFRFVVYYKIYNNPILKPFFKICDAIPIASPSEDRKVFDNAFMEIDKTLKSNKPIFIFPEGKLTGDGLISPVKGGIEHILSDNPVGVHVVAIKGLWGSLFSRMKGKSIFGRFRKKVHVVKGNIFNANDVSRDKLKSEFENLLSSTD